MIFKLCLGLGNKNKSTKSYNDIMWWFFNKIVSIRVEYLLLGINNWNYSTITNIG